MKFGDSPLLYASPAKQALILDEDELCFCLYSCKAIITSTANVLLPQATIPTSKEWSRPWSIRICNCSAMRCAPNETVFKRDTLLHFPNWWCPQGEYMGTSLDIMNVLFLLVLWKTNSYFCCNFLCVYWVGTLRLKFDVNSLGTIEVNK